MKKLFVIAAIVLGTAGFSACGGEKATETTTDSTSTVETTVDTMTTTDTSTMTVDTVATTDTTKK